MSPSPPQSPRGSSSSAIPLRTYPIRYYKPQLTPTFERKEYETQWFLLSRSSDWVKPVISSLAPHEETMTFLNIEKCVRKIFKKVSLDMANVFGLPMYKPLVYEFLASFAVKHGEKMYDENCAWEFRIQNINFRWSRKEATRNLGFPLFGAPARATINQRFATWTKLTGQSKMGFNTSPYAITCKGWFYVHCLIATGINGKPDTLDTVTIEDLNILHALSGGDPVDWFDIFSEKFLQMRNHNGYSSYVGCTSLITFIAQICGFQFYCQYDEYRELDHAHLKKLRMLAGSIRGTYRPLVIKEKSLTDVSEEEEEHSEADGKEKGECSKSADKKRKVEIHAGLVLPEGIPWKEVRKVTICEF